MDIEIREAFLRFFASIIGHYRYIWCTSSSKPVPAAKPTPAGEPILGNPSQFWFFLHFYRKCLIPLLSAPSERSCDASHLFDQKLFLKHCPSLEWPFFRLFFDTQIFNAFVEQLSFAHTENTSLVFFDECTEKVTDILQKPPFKMNIVLCILQNVPYSEGFQLFILLLCSGEASSR